ncbi:MAG TPA: histone [Halobacteriales archaeon]|nr:histone [Halobacteriales archaeon]
MSVELPSAPVDAIIRRNAGGLRVSADATEALAERIQTHGAAVATDATAAADADGRKTIMAADLGVDDVPRADDLLLPIAPVDRIARLELDDRYRVGADARVALASLLEAYADEAAEGAALLARHADRRTIQAEDVETYFELVG